MRHSELADACRRLNVSHSIPLVRSRPYAIDNYNGFGYVRLSAVMRQETIIINLEHRLIFPSISPTYVRYGVTAWLCGVTSIAYIHRSCLAIPAEQIRRDLELSETQMGIDMACFFSVYAIFQVPAVWLGDRWGSHRTLPLCAVIWSLVIGYRIYWDGGRNGINLNQPGDQRVGTIGCVSLLRQYSFEMVSSIAPCFSAWVDRQLSIVGIDHSQPVGSLAVDVYELEMDLPGGVHPRLRLGNRVLHLVPRPSRRTSQRE